MISSFFDRILFPIMHSLKYATDQPYRPDLAGRRACIPEQSFSTFLELSGESVALSTCELNSARVLSNPVHATQVGRMERICLDEESAYYRGRNNYQYYPQGSFL